MKKFKIVLSIFMISCFFSAINVKARSFKSFSGIIIPAYSLNYKSDWVEKTTFSKQYVKSHGAVDNISGDDREMKARLNITKKSTILKKYKYVQLNSGTDAIGEMPGDYYISLWASKWTMSSTTFGGTWVLDDYLL